VHFYLQDALAPNTKTSKKAFACAVYVKSKRIIVLKGSNMQTGTVKWFNSQKGFGFIQPSSGSTDIFVHISAVERAGMSTLNEGQKISYEIAVDKRTGKSSADRLQKAD
jgi:cold shock protein